LHKWEQYMLFAAFNIYSVHYGMSIIVLCCHHWCIIIIMVSENLIHLLWYIFYFFLFITPWSVSFICYSLHSSNLWKVKYVRNVNYINILPIIHGIITIVLVLVHRCYTWVHWWSTRKWMLSPSMALFLRSSDIEVRRL